MLKGKGDTALFFMDKALKELKPYFQKQYPNNILKYVKLLHDNAHLHNAVNVTIFLEVDKEAVCPIHLILQIWSHVTTSFSSRYGSLWKILTSLFCGTHCFSVPKMYMTK